MHQKRIADIDGLLELGWSAIDAGDYEKALAMSGVILESYTECPEAYNLHGNVLAILGHHRKAIHAFDKAVGFDPHYGEAYYFRGLSHQILKAYKKATCDFTIAIRTGFDAAEVYNARGVSHAHCENYSSALRDFSKAINLKPDFALAWFNRGITHAKLGRDSVQAAADITHSAKLGIDPETVLRHKYCSN